MQRIISPSMLSADFGHLERDTQMIDRSAAEWVHIDVMDGVFVPNISFGFPVMKAIRKANDLAAYEAAAKEILRNCPMK